MKKYIILMLALTMVSPFTAFARLTCTIRTLDENVPGYWDDGDGQYEKIGTYYALDIVSSYTNNSIRVTSSNTKADVVRMARSYEKAGHCIPSDRTDSFSTNGNEVDLNSLD